MVKTLKTFASVAHFSDFQIEFPSKKETQKMHTKNNRKIKKLKKLNIFWQTRKLLNVFRI